MSFDLTKYADIKLGVHRTDNGNKRSEMEESQDLVYMIELKQAGATWEEITDLLNSQRTYYTTVKQNQNLYFTKLKHMITKASEDDALELERSKLLDDVEWVAQQAKRKWQELKDIQYQDEISGRVESADVNDDTDDEGNPVTSKKYSKKKVGIVEQHQAKYLDIVLKSVETRGKLLGLNTFEKKDLTIIQLLQGKILDDGGAPLNRKIGSEEEINLIYGNKEVFRNLEQEIAEFEALEEYYPENLEEI